MKEIKVSEIKKLKFMMSRHQEQTSKINDISNKLEGIKNEIEKELKLLKQYREEDLEFIESIEKKYNIVLDTQTILELI